MKTKGRGNSCKLEVNDDAADGKLARESAAAGGSETMKANPAEIIRLPSKLNVSEWLRGVGRWATDAMYF